MLCIGRGAPNDYKLEDIHHYTAIVISLHLCLVKGNEKYEDDIGSMQCQHPRCWHCIESMLT